MQTGYWDLTPPHPIPRVLIFEQQEHEEEKTEERNRQWKNTRKIHRNKEHEFSHWKGQWRTSMIVKKRFMFIKTHHYGESDNWEEDPSCFQRKKEQITKKDKDAKWLWTFQEQYWRLKCNGPCLHFSEEELFSTLNSVSSQTTKQIQRQIKAF